LALAAEFIPVRILSNKHAYKLNPILRRRLKLPVHFSILLAALFFIGTIGLVHPPVLAASNLGQKETWQLFLHLGRVKNQLPGLNHGERGEKTRLCVGFPVLPVVQFISSIGNSFFYAPLEAPPAVVFLAQAKPEGQAGEGSILSHLFGTQPESASGKPTMLHRVGKALLGFAAASLLAALLAFRPRKNLPLFHRNPFIAQTQILLALVGSAMMVVVGDNAARAFGIFAAAALIRFRTNIQDPKEITVLLICLSIGLAAGIGRLEIAVALTCFALLILWPLERYEYSQLFRAMEVEVKTYNLERTDAILKKIFQRFRIQAELRKIDPEDQKDEPSTILYFLTINPALSTDRLSQEIFSSDPRNIDSIQWKEKKSNGKLYQ
jgi:hypothetical protein